MNVGWRERETKRMQLIWCLLSNFYLNMFRAPLCPSSGEEECALPLMVFCTGCDGCDCVELGRELCALWKLLFDTARVPAPHNHSHHNQCRTPYAAVDTLILLMMGVMMPETCWGKSLIINIRLVASCWFLSLHPTSIQTTALCMINNSRHIKHKLATLEWETHKVLPLWIVYKLLIHVR